MPSTQEYCTKLRRQFRSLSQSFSDHLLEIVNYLINGNTQTLILSIKRGPRPYPKTIAQSVLHQWCKIMEGIIRDHIIEHMKLNKMFSDKQFGFISGRSTTLQLLNVLTIWSEILDEGGTIETIFCDFMKAFDKVPHQKLLYKIEKIWNSRWPSWVNWILP